MQDGQEISARLNLYYDDDSNVVTSNRLEGLSWKSVNK